MFTRLSHIFTLGLAAVDVNVLFLLASVGGNSASMSLLLASLGVSRLKVGVNNFFLGVTVVGVSVTIVGGSVTDWRQYFASALTCGWVGVQLAIKLRAVRHMQL